jgi:hypothetical protein
MTTATPVKSCALGIVALLALHAAVADQGSPPPRTPPPSSSSASPPDIGLIEFLGSVETDDASATAVLTAIDTELLPELPEKPPHETK